MAKTLDTIKHLERAIKMAERLGGRSPIQMERYRDALVMLDLWQRKKSRAINKVKKYERICKRYAKLIDRERRSV